MRRANVSEVGAVLFRALSGRNVHDAETTVAQWFSAARKAAPSLREVAPELPEEIVERAHAVTARGQPTWRYSLSIFPS